MIDWGDRLLMAQTVTDQTGPDAYRLEVEKGRTAQEIMALVEAQMAKLPVTPGQLVVPKHVYDDMMKHHSFQNDSRIMNDIDDFMRMSFNGIPVVTDPPAPAPPPPHPADEMAKDRVVCAMAAHHRASALGADPQAVCVVTGFSNLLTLQRLFQDDCAAVARRGITEEVFKERWGIDPSKERTNG